MKKIAIYTRKSKITDTGDSIGTQIKLIKDYFRNVECEFEIFEDEGFSGGNTNRPAFKLMMEKIKNKEFNLVAVYKIDRIARNIVDFFKIFEALEKEGVNLVSISEGFDPSTIGGRMTMTMLAGIAEMERMNIKQRVTDNMLELAKKGKWTGGTLPLGYNPNRIIESGKECSYLKIKEDERDIVEDIFNLFVEGYSARKISKIINEKYNLTTSPTRVSYVLYSPIYVESTDMINKYLELNGYAIFGVANGNGYLTYQKTTYKTGSKKLDKENKTIAVPSKHEAIIKADIWIKAQERLKQTTVAPSPRISQYTFLAKMVKCEYCNEPMNVWCERNKQGNYYRFFRKTCKCNHGTKNGSRLKLERGEELVYEILKRLSDIGVAEYLKKNLPATNDKNKAKKLGKELLKISKMINNLTDKLALTEDKDMAENFSNRISDLIKEKKEIQEKLLILEQRENINLRKSDNTKLLNDTVKNFVDNFNKMSIEEKQIEIRKVFEYVTWDGINQKLKIKLVEL